MHLDGPRADEQDFTDLPAGFALGDEQHHVHLPVSETGHRAIRRCPLAGLAA
jgi:hypothetical protein